MIAKLIDAIFGGAGIKPGQEAACQEIMRELLTTLEPRTRQVIELRFGLEDGHVHIRKELARQYSVSSERIHQIEAKGLRMLRHPSRSRHLREFLQPEEA